ncbi:antibiotic biosynthesis monooxygenase [Micromonospora sp. WMMA1998]|uniref:Antibiotic biosynthesis monooxygenase n=1 Tax=Micromonospora sediminicola TaxID=946078 RepID=A0A1A9BGC2_9ACTN|nr:MULTISPECIES: antibiotic biosynthesis monooxygenase family protein [Micromonospora]PGH43281.1 antibiotic biosynthesis monooxygenase [Micromonospora sp. WMMA1996]WBC18193.1 antibiotic biosynthesis monooxygenase [Micromonospora sp. WMMA1998]SBT68560.1 Antibiotic biosynthesis monooxygenase [Micromonospora sediminicola]
MLIVAGTLYVDPARRDAYLASCAEAVRAARAAPGCVDFAVSADLVEPGRINVYERWESDEQLLAFRGSGPDAEQVTAILGAEVHKFRISGVEAP